MTYSLIWLPNVLKNAGLKVALVPGWQNRGHGDVGPIFGVICHHTGTAKSGNMPSLDTLLNGRPDLTGPLAQLGLGRDGTYYVLAAGKCNHAGQGSWKEKTSGNTNFIGIEAENGGRKSDSWPDIQMDAYCRGVAAILKHVGRSADFCAGHKEYALPAGRKPDPLFDMVAFRNNVAAIIDGSAPAPKLIPSIEPSGKARPTLRRGATGSLVKQLQEKIGINQDGDFGSKTEAAMREFQRDHNLIPDGIVGPKTWEILDSIS